MLNEELKRRIVINSKIEAKKSRPIFTLKDPTFLTRDAAFAQAYERRMVRQGKYKLIMDNNPLGTELYDLVSDPGERINLARDLKDVSKPTSNTEYLTIIEQLQRRMLMWYSETEGIKDVRAPNQQF